MREVELRIEKVRTDELLPYYNNAKKHPRRQIEQIANSIREFGNCDPIAVWTNAKGDYEIVEGHGRLMALDLLGVKEAPVIFLDHLTDDQRRAYAHVHNQLTMNTGFDLDILDADLAELDFDFGELGFDFAAGGEEEKSYEEAKEDGYDLDAEKPEPLVKPGDVFALGEHRLMCGDSTEPTQVSKLMNGEKADLLLTDPPYNVDYTGGTRDKLKIENDSFSSEDDFEDFLTDALSAAIENVKPGGGFYVWHASMESHRFRAACERAGVTVRQVLVWNKSTFSLGRQDYQWKHEPCLYGWKDGAAHHFTDSRREATVFEDSPDLDHMEKDELLRWAKSVLSDRRACTVIDCEKPARNGEHPTMKPVKLMAYQICNSTRPGEIVLDVFGGSGSTMIACEQMGRKCRMMELDPHYCDVIIDRWQAFTGEKAIRVG